MRRRHELKDEQWDLIREHLPGKAGDPGRTAADNRLFLNAVLYVLNTGIPWADLPERFGKPGSVWRRYDRWCASGAWERVARVLIDAGVLKDADADADQDLDAPEELQLDSTTIKAHPTAATGRRLAGEKKMTPTPAAPWAAAAGA
jgi:transposase